MGSDTHKQAGGYDELMMWIFCGADDMVHEIIPPWTPQDEALSKHDWRTIFI